VNTVINLRFPCKAGNILSTGFSRRSLLHAVSELLGRYK